MAHEDDDDEEPQPKNKISLPTPPRRRYKKLKIPKREPSIIPPQRKIIFITPDKTTCVACPCYPKEDPYVRPKKLNPCLKSPPSLYELSSAVVDGQPVPAAFSWDEEKVAQWISEEVGLPRYRNCFLRNKINGMRLILLEDPSTLPEINIRDFEHIKKITAAIRQLYGLDFILFSRSVGLPPRRSLVHCTRFQSRTGPSWGIRRNWTRCDILRWMKILNPEPVSMDHWDLVWYMKPDFPKTMFARIPGRESQNYIPHYVEKKEECKEYLTPRKFRLQRGIPDQEQFIWMERTLCEQKQDVKHPKKKRQIVPIKESRLYAKDVKVDGLSGKEFLLARRKMAAIKFFTF